MPTPTPVGRRWPRRRGQRKHPREWNPLFKVMMCFGLAWTHMFLVSVIGAGTQVDWLVALSLLIPAVITSVAFPIARRRWWRWFVLAWLAMMSMPPGGPVILLVGETWLWYRCWFIEYHTMDPPEPLRLRERVGGKFGALIAGVRRKTTA